MGLFDIALERRFDESDAITQTQLTDTDMLLIKDSATGAIMRLPFSVLTAAIAAVLGSSGTNTGDETTASIKSKLGITTLSGSNTGDQTTITGNAGTATRLLTARTINGVSFTGAANITINAVDSTARVASSLLGVPSGVATLDSNGLVPAIQLPSYVDDVLEYANLAAFPATGESGKIYVAIDTRKTYRWSGTAYAEVSPSDVNSVAGKTGNVVLIKDDVGLANVDNTTDANKPVSTATATALALKAALASPTFSGTPLTPTAAATVNNTQIASTAFVRAVMAAYGIGTTQLASISTDAVFDAFTNLSGMYRVTTGVTTTPNGGTGMLFQMNYVTDSCTQLFMSRSSTGKIYNRVGTAGVWGVWKELAQMGDLTKANVGLSVVENTALSTWAGSNAVTTVGDVVAGTWKGTSIARNAGGNLANGAAFNFDPGTARFVGFFVVTSINSASASVRTQTTFSAFIFEGDATSIQQISTANGSGGGSPFTVAWVNGSGFVITNTSGGVRSIYAATFGTTQG